MIGKYALAFFKLAPNSVWSCTGDPDVYENYVWGGPENQPSKDECDSALVTIEAEKAHDQVKRARQAAYQAEADPLYFGFQRGENTEQDWLDKVAEIRARYPYPA
jgi:hypothetical protein